MPLSGGGIRSGDDVLMLSVNQSKVSDTDDAPARVAFGIAEGIKLFEVDILDADLFLEFTRRRAFERFVNIHETTWQRPAAFEWLLTTADEQYLEIVVRNGEDH